MTLGSIPRMSSLRRIAGKAISGGLVLCMAALTLSAAPSVPRGASATSESEAPQQQEEEQQQESSIKVEALGASAGRQLARCTFSRVLSSHQAAATARRESRVAASPPGHRLSNGLMAPLRC
jgi:hypothetical protein